MTLPTPSYSVPVLHKNTQRPTYRLVLNDPELGIDIRSYIPFIKTIASLIASRLVKDPDPTTLKTAIEYLDKVKQFIEQVVKFTSPNDNYIRDAMDFVERIVSSLEQIIGSDEDITHQKELNVMQKT